MKNEFSYPPPKKLFSYSQKKNEEEKIKSGTSFYMSKYLKTYFNLQEASWVI
jgi:hypothetical protein